MLFFRCIILRHLFSVCSDVRKIKDKCRLCVKDYVELCKYVYVHASIGFQDSPIVCILTVCLKNKHLVKYCKEFVHLPDLYDRQIEGSDASSK